MRKILFSFVLTFSLVTRQIDGFSSLFKDKEQALFASSLNEYYIINPAFYLNKHMLQKLSWKTIKNVLPDRFYTSINFNHRKYNLELFRKRDLLRNDFHLEDEQDDKFIERQNPNSKRKLVCYYSGRVLNDPDTRVSLSICDGLKGFITFSKKSYLVEPMREVSRIFLHLLYESKAELNSTHNPQKGKDLKCSTTKQYSRDAEINQSTTFHGYHSDSKTDQIKNKQEAARSGKSGTRRSPIKERSSQATVEVFIVVDRHMVEFHGNDSIQNYVLTMMNMVSDMYKDPSLGVVINIVVAKLLILNSQPQFNITHNGDTTLFKFCEWQFLRGLIGGKDPNMVGQKYDVALLLTRKDVCAHSNIPCGTIGLAYIGGMCSTNRKCAIVEDIGLNTAYTIAHELGHNLGMTHDGIDNSCEMESSGYPHMMAAHWPTSNHISMRWSNCSAKRLKAFLNSYKSYCIQDEPDVSTGTGSFQMVRKFPGELYNPDMQCRQQYGGVARYCRKFKVGQKEEICKQLWCEVEGEKECVSHLDPAAKGTECAPGKWCMYGKCISNTEVPDAVDGGWSEWRNWTLCSRSCGVGVSYKERFCNNPFPRNGGRFCNGGARIYKTCNVQACSAPREDFRKQQCQQFNNATIRYLPVHSQAQPCALHCRPESNNAHYSVKLKTKVSDATPCFDGSSDICIDGRCEKLGCDLKLNSKIEKDVCGVCGGDSSSCNLVEGEFTQPLGRGYVNAVDIPTGARNVLVQEVKPCPSFLALVCGHGSYHINGNFTIELPGKYNVNGTVVYYRRRGTQEFFWLEGPVRTKLHFKVLFQDFNFGVKYRYVVPLNSPTDEDSSSDAKPGSFGWMQGAWMKCSVVCGGGIKRRGRPRCLHIHGRNISLVSDNLCSGAKKPPSAVKACNEHKCPKVWSVTPWSRCSRSCGLGRKKRTISCKGLTKYGRWVTLDPNMCTLSVKPVAIHTCVEKACYLSWRVSKWSKCPAKCGGLGLMFRTVSCPRENACLTSTKPISRRLCRATKCAHSWTVQAWAQCSKTCGEGLQTREVICRVENTFQVSPGKCSAHKRPNTTKACNYGNCEKIEVLLNKIKSTAKTIREIEVRSKLPVTTTVKKSIHSMYQTEIGACVDSGSWYCQLQSEIAKFSKGTFCDNERERRKCCKTCFNKT